MPCAMPYRRRSIGIPAVVLRWARIDTSTARPRRDRPIPGGYVQAVTMTQPWPLIALVLPCLSTGCSSSSRTRATPALPAIQMHLLDRSALLRSSGAAMPSAGQARPGYARPLNSWPVGVYGGRLAVALEIRPPHPPQRGGISGIRSRCPAGAAPVLVQRQVPQRHTVCAT